MNPFIKNNVSIAYTLGALLLLLSGAMYQTIAVNLARSEFGTWLATMAILWALAYAYIRLTHRYAQLLAWGIGGGIVFRCLYGDAMPVLSDDVYRFVWDGRLLCAGINPFLYLPSELMQMPIATDLQLGELYPLLNSPHYYSVYPPLSQGWFGAATYGAGFDLSNEVWRLRAMLVGVECLTMGGLWLLLRPTGRGVWVLWYALNPFIVVELVGNLHFEAAQVCALVWALWCWHNLYIYRAAVLVGVAALCKLLPLVFMPFFIVRLGWRQAVVFAGLVGLVVGAAFLPFVETRLLANIGSSINLYMRSFEFNASLYYLIREAGFWLKGYNVIQTVGRLLTLGSLVFINWWAWRTRRDAIYKGLLYALLVYYTCATTVHPWYISNLVVLGILLGRGWALVWAGVSLLSYNAYQVAGAYNEGLAWVGLEYVALWACIAWEHGFIKKTLLSISKSSAYKRFLN